MSHHGRHREGGRDPGPQCHTVRPWHMAHTMELEGALSPGEAGEGTPPTEVPCCTLTPAPLMPWHGPLHIQPVHPSSSSTVAPQPDQLPLGLGHLTPGGEGCSHAASDDHTKGASGISLPQGHHAAQQHISNGLTAGHSSLLPVHLPPHQAQLVSHGHSSDPPPPTLNVHPHQPLAFHQHQLRSAATHTWMMLSLTWPFNTRHGPHPCKCCPGRLEMVGIAG